jgi:phospholipid/cholesterol/gamma-HCH transport system substrate-binding protein
MSEGEDEDLPNPPKPRGHGQNVWVGVFLIVGLAAVVGILALMTEPALFRGRYVLETTVPNAAGIRNGDPVQMRGVNIGRVLRFKMADQGVTIQLEIEGEYPIPKDSLAELRSGGLLQGMIAEIVPGKSSERARHGDELPGKGVTSMGEATTRITSQVETVVGRMETLLSQDTIQDVHSSTSDLRQLMKTLSATVAEQRRELNTLTGSLKRSSSGLEKAVTGPELERTVKRLDALAERMEGVTTTLEKSTRSVDTILARIERGEGTLGRLSKDDALYQNLSDAALNMKEATANVSKLTDEIRRNPKRYLKLSVF